MHEERQREIEEIGAAIVDCAYRVHRELGCGLLEKIYERCLIVALRKRGLRAMSQVALAVEFEGERFEDAYYADILVEDLVVIELKAVEKLQRIHEVQLVSYLKLGNFPLGFLINFHTERLKDGLKRRVCNYYPDIPPRVT